MGALRLFLAVSVLVGHSGPLFGLHLLPGYEAVRIFFMVSGFYMALVLAERYRGKPGLFYSNRALRLYPAYWLALALTLAVAAYAGSLPAFPTDWRSAIPILVPNLTLFGADALWLFHRGAEGWAFTMGMAPPASDPAAVKGGAYLVVQQAWSLGAEVLFYAMAPALAQLRARYLIALALAAGALMVAVELWRAWATYFLFPANLGFFLAGMLAFRAYQLPIFKLADRRIGRWVALGVLALLAGREFVPFFRNYQWLHFPIALFGLPFIFSQSQRLKWDRLTGELSYPVYLFHVAIIEALGHAFGRATTLAALAVTLLLSASVVLWVDEPLARWRAHRVRAAGRMTRAPPAAAPAE
jgi:peptidoglycan/LPS O-acetylase OafA/YrhL